MTIILIIYAGLVAGLLAAEIMEASAAQRILKPAAALGFILIALKAGALDTLYEQLILLGLLACALGDVFLLSRKSQKLFLAGMAAFAIGHLSYLSAFVSLEPVILTAGYLAKAGIAMMAGAAIFAWLNPHLPKDMGVPVLVYFLIILLMVIRALGLPAFGPLLLAMIGAVMFAVSDVFVGRDRFVSPSPWNALAITPLYFGAQALIALSTQAGV